MSGGIHARVADILESRHGIPGYKPFRVSVASRTAGTRRRGEWKVQFSMSKLSEALHAEGMATTIDLVEALGPPMTDDADIMSDALRQEALDDLAADSAPRAAEIIAAWMSDEIAMRAERVAACRQLGLPITGAPDHDLSHASFDRWVLTRAGTHHGMTRTMLARLVSQTIADERRTVQLQGRNGALTRFDVRFVRTDDRWAVVVHPWLPIGEGATFDGSALRLARSLPDTPLDAAIGHPLGELVSTGQAIDARPVVDWHRTSDGVSIRVAPDLVHPDTSLATTADAS